MIVLCGISLSGAATTLTFEGFTATDFDPIPQDYGDNVTSTSDANGDYREGNGFTPNVTARYRTRQDYGNGTVTDASLSYWDQNYGDLRDVAFAANDGDVAEITLTADAGYQVVLNSFDMAGWNRDDLTGDALRIYNGDYSTLLYERDPHQVSGSGPGNSGDRSTFTPNVSANELHIQWGRDWNIGIDNVNFDQRAGPFVGSGSGLLGAYCNRDSSNETAPCDASPDVTRIDATVNFRASDGDWPASGIDDDTFSVRWTGQIQAQYTEDYTFHALHDDGVRVWVDGTLVIDDYVDQDDNWSDSGTTLSLQRGQKYDIVIEYYENLGDQDMVLGWSSASTPLRTVVPESQLYPPAGPSANLLAAYRFDESAWDGTSGQVTDASGNGRDGTAQGGADTALAGSAIDGDPGTCGYGTFNGSDDYVDVSNLSDTLDGTATLAFWVRTTQTGNDTGWQAPGIAGVEESGGTDDIFWGWIDGSGRIGISVANDFAAEQKSTSAINDGTWHHVALTRDASGGETRVYVDGTLESTGSTPTGVIGTAFESIGRIEDTGGSPEYFEGDLDEVRIYDGVLEEDEVQYVRDLTHPCPFQCGPGGQFSDSFEDGTLAPWQRQGGPPSRAGVSEATAADGSRSLFLRHDSVRVRSPQIDLAAASSADLSIWVQRGDDSFSEDPDFGEDLLLQYRNSSDNWVTLQTFPGAGAGGEIFDLSFSLPVDALHSNFRLRLNYLQGSGSDFDYWHVDNVCLTASGAGVDRFALAHDGAGINCRAEDVALRAEDASGNLVTDYTGSVDLSTTTNNGDWAIGTGNGTLAGGSGDDGSATYTFADADNGEVTLSFSNTHAETLNIDATDGTASDDDTEGDITFRPWGLEFTPDPIPTQIAGRPFDLTLTAVGELPSDPGCNVIEEYDGDRDLAFWFDYEDPGSGSVDVTVDGTGIASSEASASDQSITFNNGTATVPVDYRDAGEIQLHAQDDDGIGEPPAGGGDELVSGGSIGGGTNPFVVRPFGFYVDFDPDGDGTFDDRAASASCGGQISCAGDATGDVFATAGADFGLRIAAVVWQSADDSDDDGRPDGNRILADNALTPNFGQEAAAETVDLTDTLVAPSPGTAGSLANATGIGGFSGGAREVTDLRYSEVGIIDLEAALSDAAYLGSVDVTGTVDDVGRFIPADFAVDVRDAGMYAATCNGTFSYVGEAFGYAAEPMLDITARNAGGTTTENYRGNFIKLGGNDVDVTPPSSDASAIGNVSGTTDIAVTSALNTGAVADDGDGDAPGNGVLVYTFDGGDSYTYDKVLNARIDAFNADLPLTVDGVTDGDGVTNGVLPSPNPFTPTGAEIRFGQLNVQNAYGPETEDLTVSLQAEYFDGDGYTLNAADDCTPLSMTGDANHARVQLDDNGSWVRADETVDLTGGTGGTTDGTGVTGLASGVGALTLASPGPGNTGFASVRADLADFPWLRGDWDDDGSYDDFPTGRATFGVYRGHDRVIYWREVQ